MIKLMILVIIGILIISLGYFCADAKHNDKKHHANLAPFPKFVPDGVLYTLKHLIRYAMS